MWDLLCDWRSHSWVINAVQRPRATTLGYGPEFLFLLFHIEGKSLAHSSLQHLLLRKGSFKQISRYSCVERGKWYCMWYIYMHCMCRVDEIFFFWEKFGCCVSGKHLLRKHTQTDRHTDTHTHWQLRHTDAHSQPQPHTPETTPPKWPSASKNVEQGHSCLQDRFSR